MTIKKIPAIPVLYFGTRTTLSEIGKLVDKVASDLYATAARHDLLPTGPLHWIYTGADGKPDTEFNLEIALPVNRIAAEKPAFSQKILPSFECVATHHNGSWDHLYETYDRLIDDVFAKGKKPSGICREQYLFMDFNNPTNNITEVQVGIQS